MFSVTRRENFDNTMDTKLWQKLVENQNDIFLRLVEILENIRKLGRPLRTKEKVAYFYERFRNLWRTFLENHQKLVVDARTPEEYIKVEFVKAVKTLKELNEFVVEYNPDIELIPIPEVFFDPVGDEKPDPTVESGKVFEVPTNLEDKNQKEDERSDDNPDLKETNVGEIGAGSRQKDGGLVSNGNQRVQALDVNGHQQFSGGVIYNENQRVSEFDVNGRQQFPGGNGNGSRQNLHDDVNDGNQRFSVVNNSSSNGVERRSGADVYSQQFGPPNGQQFFPANNGHMNPPMQPTSTVPYYYMPTQNGFMPMYPSSPHPIMNRAEESRGVRCFKIADLKIKPFNGEFSEYKNFRRSFMKLHEDYNDGEKLEYLRGKLIGAPFEEIRYLDSVSENYTIAWKILDEAYDNERFQLESNLRKLFHLPRLAGKDIQSIKTFKQELNGILSNLTAQEVNWKDIVCFYAVNRMETTCQDEFYGALKPLKRARVDDLLSYSLFLLSLLVRWKLGFL